MFDWIAGVIERTGALGIVMLMLAENVFPPIPSELIMPLAGFNAARGQSSLVLAVLAGTLGSVLGALAWYYVGRRLGLDRIRDLAARHGRWLVLSPDEIDRAHDWFKRHGAWAVFLSRLIPGLRTLISVPAGISRMPLPGFLAWTSLGTVLWMSMLAGAGYLLQSEYGRVAEWVNPATSVLLGLAAVAYIYRVVTFKER